MKFRSLVCLVLVGMTVTMFIGAPDACIGMGNSALCDHDIRVLIFAVLGAQVIAGGLVIGLMYRGQQPIHEGAAGAQRQFPGRHIGIYDLT